MQNLYKVAYKSCKWMLVGMLIFVNTSAKESHAHHHSTQNSTSPIEQMLQAMHKPMMEVAFVKGEDIDVNFISNMIPHHQGAVDSAEILLKHSKNKSLKQIAQNIITAQKAEIEEFKALLPSLEKQDKLYSPKEITLFNKQAEEDMQTMHSDMNIDIATVNNNIDKAFIQAMIPHHQGAINASKQVLQYTQNATVAEIAKRIINDQEKEIVEFEAMLAIMQSSASKKDKK